MPDVHAIADEVHAASGGTHAITPFTARDGGLDLATAYAVEADLAARRRATGHRTVGLKVGYANKAVWRVMKLETLVWASMYDDTVSFATEGQFSFSLAGRRSPKIEPEIVFKLRSTLPAGLSDAAEVLTFVEWIALGFEIIDCPYPEWRFQPADFVAAGGLHAGLVVGAPHAVSDGIIPPLAEALPSFTVSLAKDGVDVATGSGKNSLRSPALCLAELATALAARGAAPLGPGDLVSSGTLTDGQAITPGEIWSAAIAGLDLAPLRLTTVE